HPGALPHYNFSRARALDSLTTYSSDTASYQAASQSLDMAERSPSLPLFSFPLPGYPPVFYATVGQPPGTAAPL
ncbi:MAG TPA: hypothetical protein V6C72_19030, partial [Chroococcales cyanobacterium]